MPVTDLPVLPRTTLHPSSFVPHWILCSHSSPHSTHCIHILSHTHTHTHTMPHTQSYAHKQKRHTHTHTHARLYPYTDRQHHTHTHTHTHTQHHHSIPLNISAKCLVVTPSTLPPSIHLTSTGWNPSLHNLCNILAFSSSFSTTLSSLISSPSMLISMPACRNTNWASKLLSIFVKTSLKTSHFFNLTVVCQ